MFHPNLEEAGIEPIRLNRRMDDAELFRSQMADAMKAVRMSQTRLAELLGLPAQSAVSNILKGTRKVSHAEAIKIRSILRMEEGPPARSIPLIGLASAGNWQEAIVMPRGERLIPKRLTGSRGFAVEVVGDSMNQLLPEGGWAIVDPDQTHLFAGKVYLIANADEETTIKRYCGEPARFEPVSDNETHKLLILTDTPYRVIGRVVSYGSDDGL